MEVINMNCVGNFLCDVGCEMKKVSWFKKNELICYIIIVIFIVVFMIFFFVVVDYGILLFICLIFWINWFKLWYNKVKLCFF